MATKQDETAAEYRCPGERSAVSQAVHLGRLARFYPPCRRCAHRDDTATLSAGLLKRLAQTRRRAEPGPVFDDEGAAGVYLNELDAPTAGQMAAALGACLRREFVGAAEPPVAIIAGDGRPLTAEAVAAVGEGLRWSGCHVVDIGPATAGCASFAIDRLAASGGILVGNPTNRVQTIGLKFWAEGARPLSAGGGLDAVRRVFHVGASRPTRKYGSLRRFQAEAPYLAGLAEHYHALRPLRLVLDTNCPPVAGYLRKLTGPVACRVIPCRTAPDRLADQVRADGVHFAARIDDDGQRCRLVDERGREVSNQRFFLLLARHLLSEQPDRPIVVEDGTSADVVREIRRLGGRVIGCDPRRAEMDRAVRRSGAILGGGPSGRFWHRREGDHRSPDALVTLTLLLRILSQSDHRLSEVLDAEQSLR